LFNVILLFGLVNAQYGVIRLNHHLFEATLAQSDKVHTTSIADELWESGTKYIGRGRDLLKNASEQVPIIADRIRITTNHVAEVVLSVEHLMETMTLETLQIVSEKVSPLLEAQLEDIKTNFPAPEEAASHEERREMANRMAARVEHILSNALIEHGASEDDIHTFFKSLTPGVVNVVVIIGDLAEQHPTLTEALVISVAALCIPEGLILRPIFGLFGFSPAGPVKGMMKYHSCCKFMLILTTNRIHRIVVSTLLLRCSYPRRELVLYPATYFNVSSWLVGSFLEWILDYLVLGRR
jgi:hypothetical protein